MSETTSSASEEDYPNFFSEIDANNLRCEICNVIVRNDDNSVTRHVESSSHDNAANDLLKNHDMYETETTTYYCDLCESTTDNLVNHIKYNIDHKNWNWLNGGINQTKLEHYVYGNHVDNDEAKAFKSLYRSLLVVNTIRKYNDKLFSCEACDIKRLTRISELDHVFGERHREGLLKYQRLRKC